MTGKSILTVEEILKLPQFKYAAVIAGRNGLSNKVVWSHVMEVTNCRDYINGNDFILTTGAGWKDIEDVHLYFKQLIEAKAAALCVQLGTKFNFFDTSNDIPVEIIKEAEQNNFPIIVFPKNHECRYIDLIRDIHALIINSDYKLYLEQESFINELNEITI
jgi:PucR family transcriptional regulator, purine catabolism regulatory protein